MTNEAVTAVLSGETGIKSIKDYRNVDVLSAFTPLEIEGVTWGLLSEIDVAEVMQDKENMQASIWQVIIVVILILLPLTLMAGFVIARGISTPINNFISQINRVANEKI